jgi:tRNA (guanine-N7-)-methyltransferase
LRSSPYYRSLAPLIQPESHSRPLDWTTIFRRQAPLELEIGFGNGEYINRRSLANPGRDFVGLEVSWASLKRALRRLADPPRPNVKLIMDKAQIALASFFAPESLAVCRLLFPLPWPNQKQAGQRLCQRDFLDLVADRLLSDGLFIMVTDNLELADWVLEQAQSSALSLSLSVRPPEWDTKYERKWQEAGQRIFYCLAGGKTCHPALQAFKEIDVQALYRTEFVPENFRPSDEATLSSVIRFNEFIFDSSRAEGLLRTMVIEGHLAQDFYIRLRREPDGRWKVSPAAPARLFPTQGLARALELAAGRP